MMNKLPAPPFQRYRDPLFLSAGVVLALLLRLSLISHESLDYTEFLRPWYEYIRGNGGLYAPNTHFANYTPPFLYLMALVSELFPKLPSLYAIKLIPVAFDFIGALFVYKLVRLRYASALPKMAYLTVLLAPTVVLNGAFWGQSDIIYTTALVACIYFLAVKRELPAFIAFGLALAVKLQAVFLLPFLLVLLARGRVSWKSFLAVPLVYLALILPAWALGRPLGELFGIYLEQSNAYRTLAMNAPNLYQWLPNDLYNLLYPAGMLFAAAVGLGFVWVASKLPERSSPGSLVSLALASLLLMPYVLPKMHDRYFFAADVLSIAFAFFYPRLFYIPLLVGGVSFFAYTPFLFGYEIIPLRYLAVIQLATLALLFNHLGMARAESGESREVGRE